MEILHTAKIEMARNHMDPASPLWRDAQTGQTYRRVVGGLAWPATYRPDPRPGALVVLVEHRAPMPGQAARRVEVVAEFCDPDPVELLRRASLWGDLLCCRAWVTPVNVPELALLHHYNTDRRRYRLPVLDVASPPSINGHRDFAAYDRLVERRTQGVKTLFFGEGGMVAREYKSRGRADALRRMEEFPLIAAFLWALAAMDMEEPLAGAQPGLADQGTGGQDSLGGY